MLEMLKEIPVPEKEFRGGAEYNQNTRAATLPHEIRNSYWNHSAIVTMLRSGQGRDLADDPKRRGNPVLLIGSGPSLDDALPLIADWEGDVICSQSQASTLVFWGKKPTYVLCYDPRTPLRVFGSVPEGSYDGTTLIAHPGIPGDILPMWPSDVAFFRIMSTDVGYYELEQALGYSWPADNSRMIQMGVRSFASSVGCAAAICSWLEYRPIFLVGVDFGYPGKKQRFTKLDFQDGKWVAQEPREEPGQMVSTSGCPTDRIQLTYKRAMVMAWVLDKSPMINCSPEGALADLMPTVEIGDVIARQGRGFAPFSWKKVQLVADRYLAEHDYYAIYFKDKGVIFVEAKSFADYEKNLRRVAKDQPIDVDENLRRIRKALR